MQPPSLTPSSSGASANGDDTPSPKSHTTQLINLREMQQLRQQLDDAAAAAAAVAQQQQLTGEVHQQSANGIAAPHPHAGIGARPLGSSEDSGDGDERHHVQQHGATPEFALPRSVLLGSSSLPGSANSGSDHNGGSADTDGGDRNHGRSDDGIEEEDDDERDLSVACQQAEEHKLSFQLKFTEPEGHCKTVEFTFDMREDTAECIASEMMEDLSLSADEAAFIADKIKEEIARLGSMYVDALVLGDSVVGGSAAAHSGVDPGSTLSTNSGGEPVSSSIDAAVREAVVAGAAAAAVTAFASAAAAAAANSGSAGGASPPAAAAATPAPAPAPPLATQGSASRSGGGVLQQRSRSDCASPREASGRPPSYHDLARAMREFHEAQLAAEAAARSSSCGGGDGGAADGAACTGGGLDPASLVSSSPVEVRLPNGHALDPAVLAKVAATAATAAATALNEVMPPRHGPQATSPVCTIASVTDCEGGV